jgi:hypothetical protein
MGVSGEIHAPAALPPGKEPTGNHWIGSWVGHRTGLDAVAKRKNTLFHLCRESNPSCTARILVRATPAPKRREEEEKRGTKDKVEGSRGRKYFLNTENIACVT